MRSDADLDRISQEVSDFFERIEPFNSEAGMGEIWKYNIHHHELRKIIRSPVRFDEKLRRVHHQRYYSLQTDASLISYQTRWWIECLNRYGIDIESLPKEICEADIVGEEFKVDYAGRKVSPDLLRRIVHVEHIKKHFSLPNKRLRVIELGAGYGAFARVFRTYYPESTYIIVDIPDSLFFSSGFIRSSLPDAKVLLVSRAEQIAAGLNDYDFVFIPTGLETALHGGNCDLFINTHSLGEMPNVTIDRWFDFIQHSVTVARVFMLNRFLNSLQAEFRKQENRCSVSFDPHWTIHYWEYEPPFMRCPFQETPENPCLLVMAERLVEGRFNGEAPRRSAELTRFVRHQDWALNTLTYNPFTRTTPPFVRPERCPDFTMNGTLFQLWDAIRLNPTVENTQLMLRYLRYLNPVGLDFEEHSFYADEHRRLISS
jgi:putative sugar O-methyltransferase